MNSVLRLDNCNLEPEQVTHLLTEIEIQLKTVNLLSIQKIEDTEDPNCIYVEAEGEAFDTVTVQIIYLDLY